MKREIQVVIALAALSSTGCGGESSKGGGSGGQAGTSAAGSAGTNAGGASGGNAAGSGGVPAACAQCGSERGCCDNHCVNLANDPLNCGRCGRTCDDGMYCTGSDCVAKPCQTTCADAASCCDSECCAAGQLCCDPQGPIETSPHCSAPSETGSCPMGCAPLCKCTSPDTPIATPTGDRAMATLRVGDLVYSVDEGAIRAVPVVRTNRISVVHHEVVRVKLANGAVLEISGTHPTADGRTFDSLRPGGVLDHVPILSAERIPYPFPFTYDILPGSSSGTYFAGGALIGSTLAASPAESDDNKQLR